VRLNWREFSQKLGGTPSMLTSRAVISTHTPDRFPFSRLHRTICSLVGAAAFAAGTYAADATLEDPIARAALPQFKIIPAATPAEQTPAIEIPMEPFGRWT